MTIADELEFDERDSGIGYIVSGSYSDAEGIEFDGINDGDSVSLKYNGEIVLVRDVSYEDDGVFWGTIHGFEPSINLSFGGLERGEEISFREDHVFTCSRS